ncbi:DUF2141 domain-containing protein [Gillisia limnaea]|uniref:DUF2141 domain-containing protein n=1 Tax=Gillisia limnaea (strain DSM 15749 / LMG 21470 / R-8282) TaxID=865937 RepID=H2BWD6_GILLR|nr:DUF2141 domain-containing protein [Gillisia limnaea]EHQ01879.1 Protein of unknown function DUF2141 [Gillisia limnaea DSM 15749]
MKHSIVMSIIFLSGILILSAQNSTEVEIINFDSNKGAAFIGLYNTEDSFLENEYKGKEVEIKDKKAIFTFKDIPDGIYAVSVFHDEDDNGELTTNFLGIPKESYGASNNAKGTFGPPKWENAKFEVRNGEIVKLKIRL